MPLTLLLSPKALLLIELGMNAALRRLTAEAATITPAELDVRIAEEQQKAGDLRAEVEAQDGS